MWTPQDYESARPMLDGVTTIRVLASTLMAFSVTSVALRIYVRAGILHAFGHDDWTLIAALVRSKSHDTKD